MGRGPSTKKKVDDLKKIRTAEQKLEWKLQLDKPLEVSAREHIGKFIDRITTHEAVELGAVLGLTFILKPILQGTASLIQQIGEKAKEIGQLLRESPLINMTNPVFAWNSLAKFIYPDITQAEAEPEVKPFTFDERDALLKMKASMTFKQWVIYAQEHGIRPDNVTRIGAPPKTRDSVINEQELFWWVLAFTVAVLIIKLGPSIITAFGSIGGMAGSLIGLVGVV